MSKEKKNLIIGLFVTGGLIIAVAAVVWLGASRYLEKGDTYVTYFNESVQGLLKDSVVKYRGVEAGRVKAIRVAPDNRLIEVVMNINLKGGIEGDVVAQLKAAGITGIVFIGLDRKGAEEEELSPKISFASEYPIIPSRPSETAQFLSDVDVIVGKIKSIDFKGISDNIKATMKGAEDLLSGKRMKQIMVNLTSTTGKLDRAVGNIDQMLQKGDLEALIVDVRELANRLRREVDEMHLADITKKSSPVISEIQATSESLRGVAESLQRLIDRLNESPSDLIFTSPPPTKRNE